MIPKLTRRGVILGGLTTLAGCGGGGSETPLASLLDTVRSETGVPGIAAADLTPGGTTTAAQGQRVLTGAAALTTSDRFHLGVGVRALTSSLAALLVQANQIRWETTVGEAFPEWAGTLDPAFALVTLEVLLAHRSGLVSATGQEASFTGTPAQQRLALAQVLLTQPPAVPPGTFLVSDAGYAVAGAMLERAAGSPWETLVVERLLRPLGGDAVTGWPAAGGVEAPWGHRDTGAAFVPAAPTDPFLASLNPSNNLSVSIETLAAFAQLHLRGLVGQSVALSPASLTRVHTGVGGPYALGWIERTVGGVATSLQESPGETFSSLIVLQPTRGRGAVCLVNAGGRGLAAAYTVVERLLGLAPLR